VHGETGREPCAECYPAPYRGDTIENLERMVADAEKKPGGQP